MNVSVTKGGAALALQAGDQRLALAFLHKLDFFKGRLTEEEIEAIEPAPIEMIRAFTALVRKEVG
jgi:hypothetical protein